MSEWKEFLTIIAPLVLSIVSIGIAIWSSHSTSKDANRQIEKLSTLIDRSNEQINGANCQIEKLKQLIEKQSEEIEEIKNLSSLLVKSDIENLNIEILRLNTKQKGVDIEIKMWEDYCTKYRLAYDHPTARDFEHIKLLKEKKELLDQQIKVLEERKDKLEKGGKA